MPPQNLSRRQPVDVEESATKDLPQSGLSHRSAHDLMQDWLSDLLGRWHLIALGLVLGVFGGFYYLSKAPGIYQAQTTLIIKQGTTSVMAREQPQKEDMDLRTAEVLNTMAATIVRPELLRKVAARPDVLEQPKLIPPPVEWMPVWALQWLGKLKEEPGSATTTPTPESIAALIAGWTKISVRRNTRLLDIKVSHPSPAVAKILADAIGLEYQTELTGNRSGHRSAAQEILVKESKEARDQLQKAQNAMAIYQRALATLKEVEAREISLADFSRRYGELHPKLIAAKAELTALQQRFLLEFDGARGSATDRAYWDEHVAEWNAAGNDDAAKLLVARRLLLARGNVLESEIASQAKVFDSILTRIQEAGINEQSVESEIEISSTAQLPIAPAAPKPPLIFAMASFVGLAFGTSLALLLIRLDNKIHTASQAAHESGLPILAAISVIPVKALQDGSRKGKSAAPEIPAALRGRDPRLLFRQGVSATTFAEMFRVLRASVSLLGDEKKRRITLFSSALPGEGKTLVAANFALAAAQHRKRTLLIDLDLRKPAVHKMFGLKRDAHTFGATEVLAGQASFEDAIFTATGDDNLHMMLVGKRAPNPGELLDADALRSLLTAASAIYDQVVIDSAPLLAVPDTRVIAPLADNFCLVVRADFVSKGALRAAISLLERDHTRPCGIVFNAYSEQRRLIGQNYSYGNYQTDKYGKVYRYGYGSSATYGSYGSDSDSDSDNDRDKDKA